MSSDDIVNAVFIPAVRHLLGGGPRHRDHEERTQGRLQVSQIFL